jgi:hypothetical protein
MGRKINELKLRVDQSTNCTTRDGLRAVVRAIWPGKCLFFVFFSFLTLFVSKKSILCFLMKIFGSNSSLTESPTRSFGFQWAPTKF